MSDDKKENKYPPKAYWVTIIYVLLIVISAIFNNWFGFQKQLNLNEFGDFMAGTMSPLAIFWLVMVYMQQRKEMREQVEHTEKIAKETKEQVKIMKREFNIKNEPLLACKNFQQVSGSGPNRVEISLINVGAVALHLAITEELSDCQKSKISSRIINTDEEVHLKLYYNGDITQATDAFIEFEYQNRFGKKSKYRCFFGKGATKEDFFSNKKEG